MEKYDPQFEDRLNQEYDLRGRTRMAAFLSLALYAGFIGLDAVYAPKYFLPFLALRLTVMAAVGVILLVLKRIKTSRDLIALNEDFDAYSGGKYHEAFLRAIRYQEFLILCYEHKLREAMRPPYRVHYERLSIKRKIRLRCERYVPRLTARCVAAIRSFRSKRI